MVSATRLTNCLTLDSRSSDPILPWKYFEATIFAAVIDQSFGTSTLRCSKMVLPFSFWIEAVRSSHSISSKGWTPGLVNRRLKVRPRLRAGAAAVGVLFNVIVVTSDSLISPPEIDFLVRAKQHEGRAQPGIQVWREMILKVRFLSGEVA